MNDIAAVMPATVCSPDVRGEPRAWLATGSNGAAIVYLILAAQTAVIAGGVALGIVAYDGARLTPIALGLGLMLGLAYAARTLSFATIADIVELVALLLCLIMTTTLSIVVLACSNLPLRDDALAAIDTVLLAGFDRSYIEWALRHNDAVAHVLDRAYESLNIQPFLLVALLCALRRPGLAWRFVAAWAIGLAITSVVFPFVPAYGVPPHQLDAVATLIDIRSGDLRVLGEETLRGIVYFPSFHAAAAVILAWGFAHIRVIGPVFVVLNAVMFVSAITAGHHYVIDLLAGAAVAAIAIRLSRPLAPHAADVERA